jgi:small GTP-binding protein
VKVQIWDTAGQERYRSVTSAYYRGVLGAAIVYDITSAQTFQSIPKWLGELRSNANEGVVIMLIGNKLDQETQRCVPVQDGEALARREDLLFTETSAKEATNVNECFTTLVDDILTIREGLGPVAMESVDTTIRPAGTPILNAVGGYHNCC